MDISSALQLIFTTLEKTRATRLQHQALFQAQQTILEALKQNASPQDTRENSDPTV